MRSYSGNAALKVGVIAPNVMSIFGQMMVTNVKGDKPMTYKELRKESGMNQTEFARYFNIPRRTVQNWDLGVRECPSYLIELMDYKLKCEKIIKSRE